MKLKNIHNVYFIGIGGIGMSAIARYFSVNKKNVAGYDRVSSTVTKDLGEIGVEIHYKDAIENIPSSFLDKEKTLVVYTPAISKENNELQYFIENQYNVLKRAEVLGKITQEGFCLAVAGTHGKTTTSSILGHIMKPENATSFLGGIAENYNSNLIIGTKNISVVEADEFDRSFLHLSPNIACVTSMDADHLDIYGEHDALVKSFNDFANKVSDTLVVAKGLPLKGLTYAVNEEADYKVFNIKVKEGGYVFDVKTPTAKMLDVKFSLPGKHNLMNALASIAMADIYGVPLENIKRQIATFRGVKRRFSYKIKSDKIVLIDDYAHHPTEIKAVYDSIKEMYFGKKVLAVFQPHLFSRTRDFADDFAKELSKFNELILLDIYPARELPIQGVSSDWLLSKVSSERKQVVAKAKLVEGILNSNAEVVVMIGAGDIGLLVDDVAQCLKEKYNV